MISQFPNCAVEVSRQENGNLLVRAGIYCPSAMRLDAELARRPDMKADDRFWDGYKRQSDNEMKAAIKTFLEAERG